MGWPPVPHRLPEDMIRGVQTPRRRRASGDRSYSLIVKDYKHYIRGSTFDGLPAGALKPL